MYFAGTDLRDRPQAASGDCTSRPALHVADPYNTVLYFVFSNRFRPAGGHGLDERQISGIVSNLGISTRNCLADLGDRRKMAWPAALLGKEDEGDTFDIGTKVLAADAGRRLVARKR